jgi:hypothetical protein
MCIRSESAEATESAVDAVVDVVKELEVVSPSKQIYSDLCLLLTTNKLSDHPDYRSWNPSKGRISWSVLKTIKCILFLKSILKRYLMFSHLSQTT